MGLFLSYNPNKGKWEVRHKVWTWQFDTEKEARAFMDEYYNKYIKPWKD